MKPLFTRLFLISILYFNCKAGNSQIINQIGIKTGLSISQVDWKYSNFILNGLDFKKRVALSIQAYTDLFNCKYFNVTPALGYIQKGGKQSINLVDEYGNLIRKDEITSSMDYLILNIQLKGKFRIKRFVPYLSIGPRLDYLIRSDHAFKEIEQSGTMNKSIYGLIYSIGAGYELNRFYIFTEFANTINFNKITDYKSNGTNAGVTINEKTMIINLGIAVRIK